VRLQNHFDLITDENFKLIKENYKKYLTDNNLPSEYENLKILMMILIPKKMKKKKSLLIS